MAKLKQFSPPGRVQDAQSIPQAELEEQWSTEVADLLAAALASAGTLYDPREEDTPTDANLRPIPWEAFPGRHRQSMDDPAVLDLVDNDRDEQDEYCEWSVEREGTTIRWVTFTTEVPDYYNFLGRTDPEALESLYQKHVDSGLELLALKDASGTYDPRNEHNRRIDGPIMHLSQGDNTLEAAISLIGVATFRRARADGTPVTAKKALAKCAGMGDEERNSDPKIAISVNDLARLGNRLTLADPVGLYLGEFGFGGVDLPDGVDPADCWIVERGEEPFVVRARFEIPEDKGSVNDVKINGEPVRFGAQLAQRVPVMVRAIAHSPGAVTPEERSCGSD
ncbi:MAG: hypothetical protein M3355_07535 [Actinomycetota bacterium]|nr:hypothetical protein [Actinomycetota bacterium]